LVEQLRLGARAGDGAPHIVYLEDIEFGDLDGDLQPPFNSLGALQSGRHAGHGVYSLLVRPVPALDRPIGPEGDPAQDRYDNSDSDKETGAGAQANHRDDGNGQSGGWHDSHGEHHPARIASGRHRERSQDHGDHGNEAQADRAACRYGKKGGRRSPEHRRRKPAPGQPAQATARVDLSRAGVQPPVPSLQDHVAG
jgi:hypothetical protein